MFEFDFPLKRLLKFATKHLSNNKSDRENNAAFRSAGKDLDSHNFKCVRKNRYC